MRRALAVQMSKVLDAFSCKIVGWAMETYLRTELVLKALDMALGQRRPTGAIHHSDQGNQYTSLAFGKRCREAGVRPSMGSVGDCFDNAMCESFFATLECELLNRRRFKTQVEARMAVFDFIEGWYNPHRRHSSLDYLSPINYEREVASRFGLMPRVEIPKLRQADLRYRVKQVTKRATINRCWSALLQKLNPILRGWGNFYRFCTGAGQRFASLDHYVGDRLWRWLMKKHGSLHRKKSTIRRLPSLVRPTRTVWREKRTEQFLLASLRVERFRRGWMQTPAFAMVPGEPDA